MALLRRGSKAYTKTTQAIEIGAFTVPVNFKNMVSLVALAADGYTHARGGGVIQHPHAVPVDVSWPVSEAENSGGRARLVEYQFEGPARIQLAKSLARWEEA